MLGKEFEGKIEEAFEALSKGSSYNLKYFHTGDAVYLNQKTLRIENIVQVCAQKKFQEKYYCFRNVIGKSEEFDENTEIDFLVVDTVNYKDKQNAWALIDCKDYKSGSSSTTSSEIKMLRNLLTLQVGKAIFLLSNNSSVSKWDNTWNSLLVYSDEKSLYEDIVTILEGTNSQSEEKFQQILSEKLPIYAIISKLKETSKERIDKIKVVMRDIEPMQIEHKVNSKNTDDEKVEFLKRELRRVREELKSCQDAFAEILHMNYEIKT